MDRHPSAVATWDLSSSARSSIWRALRSQFRLIGLIPVLAGLYVIGRLGSVGFAIGVAGLVAAIGLFMFATRRRPGRRYDRQAPPRADADLQTWDTSP